MDSILLKIPKKSEYISTIRLTTSALVNLKEFNIEEIEDIKVIISEICTFFIENIEGKTQAFEIEYQIFEDKITIRVCDLNKVNKEQISKVNLEDSMSIMIIESLSSSYKYDLDNNTISFEKHRRW